MKKTYEFMVLLHPDLEIDVETPIKKLEGIIESSGGKVTKRDNWGKKRLAYRIAKQDFAVYVYFEISMDPSRVRDLEKTILITEEVIRFMIVVHEVSDAPEPKSSESKDDKDSKSKSDDKVEEKSEKVDK